MSSVRGVKDVLKGLKRITVQERELRSDVGERPREFFRKRRETGITEKRTGKNPKN